MAYEAEISLVIRGDEFDPDDFTRRSGLTPTSVYRRGEPGLYVERFAFSQWAFSGGIFGGEDLSVGMLADQLVEKLADHSDFIARVVAAEDLYVMLQVVLTVSGDGADDESAPSMTFSRDTVHFLDTIGAEIDVELRFD